MERPGAYHSSAEVISLQNTSEIYNINLEDIIFPVFPFFVVDFSDFTFISVNLNFLVYFSKQK